MALDRTSIRLITVWCLVSVFAFASACLWDRDTLAAEATRNKEALTILVGGFERNPPLYYEMRIKRIEHELKVNPSNLNQYDDIAVAYDRLGKGDDAIKWIEEKRKRLPAYDAGNGSSKEHWYRYYANVGTFWAHRWVKAGAKPERLKDMKHARDLLNEALEINPDAHFGREKYQLMIMDWMIYLTEWKDPNPDDPYSSHRKDSLADFIERKLSGSEPYQEASEKAKVGLTNLIRLGGAWQSADVYEAIGARYSYPHQAMAHVCELRKEEILKAGGTRIGPEPIVNDIPGPDLDSTEIAEYDRLREVADKWHDDRTAFMLAKLRAGKHPDTDKDFWNGAPQLPELAIRKSFRSWWNHDVWSPQNELWFGLALCLGGPLAIFLIARRVVRAYRKEFPAQSPKSPSS